MDQQYQTEHEIREGCKTIVTFAITHCTRPPIIMALLCFKFLCTYSVSLNPLALLLFRSPRTSCRTFDVLSRPPVHLSRPAPIFLEFIDEL